MIKMEKTKDELFMEKITPHLVARGLSTYLTDSEFTMTIDGEEIKKRPEDINKLIQAGEFSFKLVNIPNETTENENTTDL
jgi:hypothetical protein